MVTALPTFKGWTIDERLQEFRKVEWKHGQPTMKTTPFHTLKGQMLFRSYLYNQLGKKRVR